MIRDAKLFVDKIEEIVLDSFWKMFFSKVLFKLSCHQFSMTISNKRKCKFLCMFVFPIDNESAGSYRIFIGDCEQWVACGASVAWQSILCR